MTERLHFYFSLSRIGEGNGNPLQCSCLENPSDRGAWWAAVYGISQSRTRLKRLSSSSSNTTWEARLCIHWLYCLVSLICLYLFIPVPFLCSFLFSFLCPLIYLSFLQLSSSVPISHPLGVYQQPLFSHFFAHKFIILLCGLPLQL